MRVLLHACCGPCLLEPYTALSADHSVAVCFANSNIAPPDEYIRRRDTLARYVDEMEIEWFELPYKPEEWIQAASSLKQPERCHACYRLRLSVVAAEAAMRGFDATATTLTVSPYQDVEKINAIGEQVCSEAGIVYISADFRGRYPEATRRSRERGMYRQNYCGCEPSIAEAEAGRAARRAARKAARMASNSSP